MDPLLGLLRRFWKQHDPAPPGSTVIAAVSGGPDSTALLHALATAAPDLGITLIVAHGDHGLRGADSHGDRAFAEALAKNLGLEFFCESLPVTEIHDRDGGSLEAIARDLRYAFLNRVAERTGAERIVTGHTRDDQAETFLLQLMRGSGPRGLGSMLPVGPGRLCRPLIETSKASILDYLKRHDLAYRTDATNTDLARSRNWVRHVLMPILRSQRSPEIDSILAGEASLFAEIDDFFRVEAARVLEEMGVSVEPEIGAGFESGPEALEDSSETPVPINLPRLGLLDLHPALRRAVLREFLGRHIETRSLSRRHLEALDHLLQSEDPSGEVHLPRGLRARRRYEALVFEIRAPKVTPSALGPYPTQVPLIVDPTRPGEVLWQNRTLAWMVETPAAVLGSIPNFAGRQTEAPDDPLLRDPRAWFDAGEIVPPLWVRALEPGDRLEPLGMEGSRKISDVLVDDKIPREARAQIGVLCDNGGPERAERLLWVVGLRRSRHATVDSQTKRVIAFRVESPLF